MDMNKMRKKQQEFAAKMANPSAEPIKSLPTGVVEPALKVEGGIFPPKEAKTAKKAAPKSVVREKGPTLKHRCGHEKGIKEYENMDCPSCRSLARAAAAKKRREKKMLIPKDQFLIARLPHGSRYEKTYDAEKTLWSGSLTIPGVRVFTGESSAERKLEHLLDRQYREWLVAQAKAEQLAGA